MKVYMDFKCLDAEDMPSNISNQYNLKVRSINGGSEYRNVELVSLADYTKQVRKEVCEEIKENAISHNNLEVDIYYITPQQLYEIEQGKKNE